MGRAPVLGRTFSADEPDGHQVVLNYRLWQMRFGGSPRVLGQTVELNGLTSQIVGVMPQGFAFPSEKPLLWTLASAIPGWQTRRSGRGHGFGPILCRLRPARSSLTALVVCSAKPMASLLHQIRPEYVVFVLNLICGTCRRIRSSLEKFFDCQFSIWLAWSIR